MNRSLKLSMLLALALGSSQAAALELGQIQIKSALGQPLVADIPVKPDHAGELDHLTAQLASAEDFSRAGVIAPPMLLQFAVVDGSGGQKLIRVTSSVPVNDPYLDILVELNTGSSKSVREFAVLLDPPAGAVAQAPATSSPSGRHAAAPASAPARSTRVAAAPAPAAAPAQPRHAASTVAEGGKVTVERGQTLSGIAKQSLTGGVDINQLLVAYKQANPDAFYRDNINALKTGAVLRVPTKDEASAVAAAAALAEVQRQNSDWRSGAARTPTSVADAGTRANATTSPTKGAGGDRLALVPAKDGGEGGKTSKADVSALHQDLQRSQEQLTSLQQQGNELKSRLKDLEDINSKNERLLALKDNQIAELQQKLADARKAAGMPAAAPVKAPVEENKTVVTAASQQPAKPATTPTAMTPPAPAAAATTHTIAMAPGANTPAHAGTTQPAASQPAAPVKPAVKPAPKPVTPAPVEEEPWFMQTWAWAAGAGLVVLLALLALLRRRKAAPAVAAVGGGSSLADRFGAAPPFGEEDIDQEELLDQLAEHPDDIGLHLELVSLYYSRRDVEHFEAAAEAMHAHITDSQQPEWQDVVHMGEDLVPNHPLFANGHAGQVLGDDERAALHHFDLDKYASGNTPAAPVGPPPIPSQKVSEYHFDFNLTPHPIAPPVAHEPHDIPQHETAPLVDTAQSHSSWEFAEEDALEAEPSSTGHHAHENDELSHDTYPAHEIGSFSDDPIDTKLDLARAYLDMGDPDGARAMLEEVLHEGSQMQKDTAQRLLDDLH